MKQKSTLENFYLSKQTFHGWFDIWLNEKWTCSLYFKNILQYFDPFFKDIWGVSSQVISSLFSGQL